MMWREMLRDVEISRTRVCVCLCVYICACVRVRACVRAARACNAPLKAGEERVESLTALLIGPVACKRLLTVDWVTFRLRLQHCS